MLYPRSGPGGVSLIVHIYIKIHTREKAMFIVNIGAFIVLPNPVGIPHIAHTHASTESVSTM